MIERIENDHHPDIVDAAKGSRRLELFGIKETLVETTERRVFFAALDDEGYTRIVGYINSVTQKRPVSFDYGDSSPGAVVTPPPEAKAPLMTQTFNTVRTILGKNSTDDGQALRRAALTMAGAINYIHPYDNGNGRTARVMHYLVEFGAERGDTLFNDELYAIIGKIPVYDFDRRQPIHDTPPPELERALDHVSEQRKPSWASLGPRERASERVRSFLAMMHGDIQVTINKPVTRWYYDPGQSSESHKVTTNAGSLTGDQLYERDYLGLSFTPAYTPNQIPPNATRVIAEHQGETAPLMLDYV
jgi:hypothetical protein